MLVNALSVCCTKSDVFKLLSPLEVRESWGEVVQHGGRDVRWRCVQQLFLCHGSWRRFRYLNQNELHSLKRWTYAKRQAQFPQTDPSALSVASACGSWRSANYCSWNMRPEAFQEQRLRKLRLHHDTKEGNTWTDALSLIPLQSAARKRWSKHWSTERMRRDVWRLHVVFSPLLHVESVDDQWGRCCLTQKWFS